MTTFWKDNIKVLFENDKLLEIFPSKKYDINRKLNSLVRLSIYYSLIMYLLKKDSRYLLISIITMSFTYFIYIKKGEKEIYGDMLETRIKDLDNASELKKPSRDNPFMNNTLVDYGKDSNKRACPSYNNVGVQNRIDELYNEGLYKDFKDVFNKNTGERQFYTMPNTEVPNNQGDFAQWLYGKPSSCKEGNSIACLSQMGRIGASGPS